MIKLSQLVYLDTGSVEMLPMMYMALIDDEGDKKAFEKLYYENRILLFSIAMKIINNNALAEEAVSDAFLSIAKNFQTVNILNAHKKHKYLIITIRNAANMILRKEKNDLDNLPLDETIVSDDDIANVDLQILKKCMHDLNQTDKEIIYLYYSLGMDHKQISDTLGISQAASRKRLQKAKQALKKLLEEEGYNG